MQTTPRALTMEEELFVDDGSVPNNPWLPLIVYRGALQTGAEAAEACMALFERNGWGGAWRNGIYAHHHYHSTSHEVLGVASGSVRVRLGGDSGKTVVLRAGDVVVVPAGVAHKSEGASPDLVVVGAYPQGQSPDMRTPGASDHDRAVARVAAVPLPRCDPVSGLRGPLLDRWRRAESS
jgi:uncharacterized protein YjlB